MSSETQSASVKEKKGVVIEHIDKIYLDPKTKKATRVGYKVEGDKKVRVSKKSGTQI